MVLTGETHACVRAGKHEITNLQVLVVLKKPHIVLTGETHSRVRTEKYEITYLQVLVVLK